MAEELTMKSGEESAEPLTPGERWFYAYVNRIEEGLRQAQESPAVLGHYVCPCCHYPTLTERGGYEICPLCWWEDDGQDDPHANEVWGGPNHDYSLAEARENFKQYRSMYRPDNDRRLSEGDSEKERMAKQAVCAAFDQMLATKTETPELMAIVEETYATLQAETTRKIEEYEAEQGTSSTLRGSDV